MDTSSGVGLATTSIILSTLGVTVVGFRIYVRSFLVRNFGWDDGMMIVAMVLTLAYLTLILDMILNFGLGNRGTKLDESEKIGQLKLSLGVQVVYLSILFSFKASIVLLYLRLAPSKSFRNLCFGTLTFLSLTLLATLTTTCLQCIPLSKLWALTTTSEGCINRTAFFYSVSAIHILLDVWILALPVKTLSLLQLPKREKTVLLAVFLMGVFSTVASIVRLYSVKLFTLSTDPFFDAVPINFWSIIEVNIAIVCASIPCLKPLLSKSTRERIMNSRSLSHRKYGTDTNTDVQWPNNYKGQLIESPAIEMKTPRTRQHELPDYRADPFDDVEQAGPGNGGIMLHSTVTTRSVKTDDKMSAVSQSPSYAAFIETGKR